jgi:hypothetical protein
MAKTEDEKRDAYYRRKYGVGLDWYNARLVAQDDRCGICRRPQESFTKRFAIDHDHSWKKVKIETGQTRVTPYAAASYCGKAVEKGRRTKREAVRAVKEALKIMSCRGLLCPFCNRGLRYYADCPNRLANAAEYLKRHQNAG